MFGRWLTAVVVEVHANRGENMKYLNFLVFVCLACVMTVHAQRAGDQDNVLMDSGGDKYHANLQLTTSVIEQRYCSDGRVAFTLRFNFTNGGGETIILDKRSSIVQGFTVSRNAQQAAAGRHKMYVAFLLGIDGKLLTLDPSPDESQFVILKSGESHAEDHAFSIPSDDKKLTPGNYVLQLGVLTWNYPRASNIQWREKWRRNGYLWTDSVTSIPMLFNIRKQPPIERCS
jgi:hypothetical protein